MSPKRDWSSKGVNNTPTANTIAADALRTDLFPIRVDRPQGMSLINRSVHHLQWMIAKATDLLDELDELDKLKITEKAG